MQNVVLPLFYLAPISWFAKFFNAQDCRIEQWENFPKQTFRNRMYIYGPNGKQSLSIPIRHKGKTPYNAVEISMAEDWKSNHWKSIRNAYQNSPYFEFYEDKLKSIYSNSYTSLLEFNSFALRVVLKILKSEKEYNFTTDYESESTFVDLRNSFSAKEERSRNHPEYYQTYSDKHGFLEDLSIIDLLCNLGPESVTYLKRLE